MDRIFFSLGCGLACLGVLAGAAGAHLLAGRFSPAQMGHYDTAVQYQVIHSLGLLAVAGACGRWPGAASAAAGFLFLAGIAVFSGSLYAVAFSEIRRFGILTPFGGLAFLAGWLCLGLAPLLGRR